MEMKYVVPDMAQSFGTLEFAGESVQLFFTICLKQSELHLHFSLHLCQPQCQRHLSRLALARSAPPSRRRCRNVRCLEDGYGKYPKPDSPDPFPPEHQRSARKRAERVRARWKSSAAMASVCSAR